MATWKEPKNDYTPESQVVPEIFNTLAENERYLQEVKITTEQVQNATVSSTQSSTRENLSASETIKAAFGKIRKVFADLKSLAFSDTVAASNVTGLAKVATSGSYNDLTNKPTIPSSSFKKVVCRIGKKYTNFEKGIYLAFMRFKNNASITNITCFGTISTGYAPNGTYSANSFFYTSGGTNAELECDVGSDGSVTFYISHSDWDGSTQLVLYKIGDLPPITEDWEDETI